MLLHIPLVQNFIGGQVGDMLSKKLGTQVQVQRIDLGFLNRLIVDGLYIADQKGKPLLKTSRLSISLNVISLLQGDISISSAQLFGLYANLYKANDKSKTNFQFLIDSLTTKDTPNHTHTFSINSLIIRRGSISYNALNKTKTNKLSLSHLTFTDISSHIVFNQIDKDSLDINLKKLSFKEQSGLYVKALSTKFVLGKYVGKLNAFRLSLPHTKITLPQITATFQRKQNQIIFSSLYYQSKITKSQITPSDLSFLLPQLSKYTSPFYFSTAFKGSLHSLQLSQLHLQDNNDILLQANASIQNWHHHLQWVCHIQQLSVNQKALKKYVPANYTHLPLQKITYLQLSGEAQGKGKNLKAQLQIASNLGKIQCKVNKQQQHYQGSLITHTFDFAKLLNNHDLGLLSANIQLQGFLQPNTNTTFQIIGTLPQIDYKKHTYQQIKLKGVVEINRTLQLTRLQGNASINDPLGNLQLSGNVAKTGYIYTANLEAQAHNIHLSIFNVPKKWQHKILSFQANTQLSGRNIKDVIGKINLHNLHLMGPNSQYLLSNIEISTGYNTPQEHYISLNSDFGKAHIVGHFDYEELLQHLQNIIVEKLPGLQSFISIEKRTATKTNMKLYAEINKADWTNFFFDIPITLQAPVIIRGIMNSEHQLLNIDLNAPHFIYQNKHYQNCLAHAETINDTLYINAKVKQQDQQQKAWTWAIQSAAANDHLMTKFSFCNSQELSLCGTLNTETQFFKNTQGKVAAHITVHPSQILVEDSIWHIEPSDIIYSKNNLLVDHFSIHHNNQHIIVNGFANKNTSDSMSVDLKNINVSYALNLLNFHSVEFAGSLSGRACLSNIFSRLQAHANVKVQHFTFQSGNMGTLDANINWNEHRKQIDIQAVASDTTQKTIINGYISPQHNDMDISLQTHNTNLQFLEDFCGSFMQDVNVHSKGNLRLYGDLGQLNLTGKVVANGSLGIIPTHTIYTLRQDTITLVPNKIIFNNNTIYDRNGNTGSISGEVSHNNFEHFKYNLHIKTDNLLAFDTHQFTNQTFYGTAFLTGTCHINGKSGELNIDVNATPQKGSQFVYKISNQTNIDSNEFIKWVSHKDSLSSDSISSSTNLPLNEILPHISSDIRLNFLVNCTPNATIKVIMDSNTGDYIALNGNGVLRATYYNKGSFDMYGNFVVDHGIYRLTVQNIIKKSFQFKSGGTIAFGGDPYNASLHLNAAYSVNSVSLSDLRIGKSFTNNNIRVNCLMDITGTPNTPKVDFSLDMPTISNDAKQMVYSLINSEEEMNQQVLYLLAVGRFYTQENKYAALENPTQQSQASLAMQSILSGTLSQQLNDVIKSVIDNTNWNFGANISPGNEGFNNAEYEGILSGQLLNNRLRINGQFGYRANPNATTNFIGDFDIRYLLYPNGNLAIKIYNQTNDRYFTRNSLTTQGVGLILKKDFTNLRDLFERRMNKKKHIKEKENR